MLALRSIVFGCLVLLIPLASGQTAEPVQTRIDPATGEPVTSQTGTGRPTSQSTSQPAAERPSATATSQPTSARQGSSAATGAVPSTSASTIPTSNTVAGRQATSTPATERVTPASQPATVRAEPVRPDSARTGPETSREQSPSTQQPPASNASASEQSVTPSNVPVIKQRPKAAAPLPFRSTSVSPQPTSIQLKAVPPPDKKPYLITSEWLVLSDDKAQAQQHRQLLTPYGLQLRGRKTYSALGMVVTKFAYRGKQQPQQLLAKIRYEQPQLTIEFNRHYYGLADEEKLPKYARYGHELTQLTEQCRQGNKGVIGILDSKVNASLPLFSAAKLTVNDVTGEAEPATHGTALAALLLDKNLGLAPNAQVYAVNVFASSDDGLRTNTVWLLAGLNELMGKNPKPDVINLSLGGIDSMLLSFTLSRIAEQLTLVAAAGNGGRNAGKVYPAAHPQVIAVSAVDMNSKVYRKANQGQYIDVVAPGVDVWTKNKKGEGYFASGTSFAAPWVAAFIALGHDKPQLLQQSKDLGSTGKDEVFGQGLLQFPVNCAS